MLILIPVLEFLFALVSGHEVPRRETSKANIPSHVLPNMFIFSTYSQTALNNQEAPIQYYLKHSELHFHPFLDLCPLLLLTKKVFLHNLQNWRDLLSFSNENHNFYLSVSSIFLGASVMMTKQLRKESFFNSREKHEHIHGGVSFNILKKIIMPLTKMSET